MNPWGNLSSLSIEEQRQLQNKKLHHFINSYVYPFSPHYQELFKKNKIDPRSIRTIDDLRRIPIASKLNFIDTGDNPDRYRDFILQPTPEKIKKFWPKGDLAKLLLEKVFKGDEFVQDKLEREFRPIFMTFTTGTTNKPVPFTYSNYDIENLNISGARMLDVFNIAKEDRIVNLFPFAPHLAFWQVFFGGLAANRLALSTGGGRVLGTEGNIAVINRIKPTMILGVPSYIYHVLVEAKERKCDLSFVKRVILGASKCTTAFKIKCKELLESMGARDVAVLGTYGFTESRCAWAECPTAVDISSGYHLYPDKEIFEVIDPVSVEVKKEGEDGELVYTSIDSRASTMIRYRTGDIVKGGISYEPCPHCGRTVMRVNSEISRLSDVKDLQLSKIKGSLVNLNNFGVAVTEVTEVQEWQLVIRKKNNDPFDIDEVVIYCNVQDSCDQKAVKEKIREKILAYTEVAPNDIVIVSRNELVKRLEVETANKEKRVLDERPK